MDQLGEPAVGWIRRAGEIGLGILAATASVFGLSKVLDDRYVTRREHEAMSATLERIENRFDQLLAMLERRNADGGRAADRAA